jgi:hypothetical protein
MDERHGLITITTTIYEKVKIPIVQTIQEQPKAIYASA